MPSSQSAVAFVVLAAGLGSRLGGSFSGKPKWMVPISDGLTVAEHQLSALEAAIAPGTPRLVITGAHAEAVDELARTWGASGRTPFRAVHNERYADWNNWYSLLLGLETLDAEGWDGPTLVINGDLFCPSPWFASFASEFTGLADITLAVDTSKPPLEEAMKVERSVEGVSKIGKVGLHDPIGEYIGLSGLTLTGRRELTVALASLQRQERFNDWYEGGIQNAIDDGARVGLWETPASPWVEIDDDQDLVLARDIAATAAA